MRHSILAKLICIYVLVSMVIIGILGVTIIRSYRQEQLDTRTEDLTEKLRQLGSQLTQAPQQDTESIMRLCERLSLEFDAAILVCDQTGSVLLGTESESIAKMRVGDFPTALPADFLTGILQKGTFQNRAVSAENYGLNPVIIVGIYTGGPAKLVIAAYSSITAIERSYKNLIQTLWLPVLLVFGVGLLLIFILNYQLTMPLLQMSSAARDIARGDFSARVTVRSQDEVGQLACAFNSMAKELAEIDATRKDFVANISHELRTPLTSVNGFVQGLLDGTIPKEETRRYLEIVHSETQRLSSLTREMLLISQVEANKLSLEYSQYDQNELMRRALLNLEQKIEHKGVEINIKLAPGRILVNADQNKIEQVIINLLDNAVKFTPRGGKISLRTYVKDNRCYCEIADTGAGIPAESQPYVFDRFYTANKARTGTGSGTGLGLAIVKKILILHNQDIKLESEPGKGAVFTFTLELARKHIKKGEPNEQ